MYALLGLAFAILVIADPSSSSSIETRPIQKIYDSALKENRTLRVSWGGDSHTCGDGITSAFLTSFPGIKIDVKCDLSKYLDGRINRARETSNGTDDGADVAVLQTLHDFPRWKSSGRLLNYKPANWDEIHPEFVDSDGAYAAYYIGVFGPTLYNTGVYQISDLPQFYTDYLAAKWTNKIILTYPNDDDAVLYLFTLIQRKYGWKFIEEFIAQNVTWVRGTATPSFDIADASRSNSISFSSYPGSPVLNSTLHSDVYMAWPQTGAIFASTQAPETAKLFLNYLLTDDFQKALNAFGYSPLKKFDTGQILKQKNVDPLGFGKFMSDRSRVERFRFDFEDLLGTPMGPDPVDVIAPN